MATTTATTTGSLTSNSEQTPENANEKSENSPEQNDESQAEPEEKPEENPEKKPGEKAEVEEKPGPEEPVEELPDWLPTQVRPRSFMRDVLSESILGYIFWSVFHGLAPMVWFYPLNQLQITGYEAYVLVWFLPLLCMSESVQSVIQSRRGLFVLRVVCVASVCSFQAPTTLLRLQILTVGNGAAMLLLCGTLWNKALHQRSTAFWGLMIGFFIMLASRIWYVSLNPAWSDARSNSVVVALGILAAIDRFTAAEHPDPEPEPTPVMAASWRRTAMGFGSLLFLTHWIYGEVSVVCRWTAKGMPFPGPHPFPGGGAVFVELLTGLLMSHKSQLPTNFLWSWFIGLHCFLGLYYFPAYIGFCCGLLLAMYVASIWPEMVDRVTSCPPGKTLALAMAVYLVEMLMAVWTTAFNFVPGGAYTRERSAILGVFVMFNIARAMLRGKAKNHDHPSSRHIAFPNLDGTGTYQIFADAKILLVLVLIAGCGGFFSRFNPSKYAPPVLSEPKQLTSMVWTAHFMYDNQGWPSFERAAKMMEDSGADVIALLESDASKPYLGLNDIGMWLGERLGMRDDFGPATKLHTWGSLFLSKYPIVSSEHLLLPSPQGELSPGLHITVNVSGNLVDFITTHMGNREDDIDRQLQAEFLANITRRSKNPTVFMGYMTTEPFSRDYNKLTKFGRLKDIDPNDFNRWCEYIFYKGLIRNAYGRISHDELSDTEIQIAKFTIPTERSYKDNDADTIEPSEVPESYWLPAAFGTYYAPHYNEDGHHYHMETPKYFYRSATKS